jgi:hypothetical protein
VTEAIPPNAPQPRGQLVMLRCYVDSDHAGDQLTRRTRIGFIQMINMAPITWFSKKQGSTEGASFGSEFVATKTAVEATRALRYKLRMMGVPIDGPTYVYCDNMSVVQNTTAPESMLKKKSNSIAYHSVREAVAMGEILIAYISTDNNIADIITKVLPGGERRDKLVLSLLWDIQWQVSGFLKVSPGLTDVNLEIILLHQEEDLKVFLTTKAMFFSVQN